MSRLKQAIQDALKRAQECIETPLIRGICAWFVLPLLMIKVVDATYALGGVTLTLVQQDGVSAWPYVAGCAIVFMVTRGAQGAIGALKSQYPLIRL